MPKIVDPERRRAEVVEAVFRLVDRGGIESASLRNVATEAGLNVGSVRHYFTSHDDLLLAAAEEMTRRVENRIAARVPALSRAYAAHDLVAVGRGLTAVFAELLPLDATRRRECAVWLAFVERSRVQPELRAAADEVHILVRDATRRMLAGAGVPRPADAAECLLAGVDGLTLTGLQLPERYPPARLRRLLRQLVALALTGAD
ncbi:TetR family transcriptional regulator [Naumannella sp. ID2617S]|nr:TetR family transcriptional regulator [Naumannella sp. ID2617S]